MIITVTLNPAVDRIIEVDNFVPGKVNRADNVSVLAGGKGINVAKVLTGLDCEVLAMGIIGGSNGTFIEKSLSKQGVNSFLTRSQHETRQNIKIIEKETKNESELNEPGKILIDDLEQFEKHLKEKLHQVEMVVFAGSLPPQLPEDTYFKLLRLVQKYNLKTVVDTSGEALRSALKAKPYFIKPNIHEVEELLDIKINDIDGISKIVDYFLDLGIKLIVISWGNKGAVFANENECFLIQPPKIKKSRVTVGAGDTLVAGTIFKLGQGEPLKKTGSFATALAAQYVKNGELNNINFSEVKKIQESIIIKKI